VNRQRAEGLVEFVGVFVAGACSFLARLLFSVQWPLDLLIALVVLECWIAVVRRAFGRHNVPPGQDDSGRDSAANGR
jgi:hypothetical protein